MHDKFFSGRKTNPYRRQSEQTPKSRHPRRKGPVARLILLPLQRGSGAIIKAKRRRSSCARRQISRGNQSAYASKNISVFSIAELERLSSGRRKQNRMRRLAICMAFPFPTNSDLSPNCPDRIRPVPIQIWPTRLPPSAEETLPPPDLHPPAA